METNRDVTACNMGRRAFLAGVAASAVAISKAQSKVVCGKMRKKNPAAFDGIVPPTDEEFDSAVDTLETTTMFDDEKRARALTVIQRAIDLMGKDKTFRAGLKATTPESRIQKLHAKFPVLRWYDREFERVFTQFRDIVVTGDKPAIWYLYNMGILVKTKSCAFGIDVYHRQALRLAPYLDFVMVTHNHGDHYTAPLLNAMVSAKKPVYSNFYLCKDGYCRELEKETHFRDLTIYRTAADHQIWLPLAVTCFEVVCGEGSNPFSLFHSGDCCRVDHLKPRTKPNIYMGHCGIGKPHFDILEAAKTTMPAKLYLPMHHQELGHIGGRCIAFQDEPVHLVQALRESGFRSAMPVWGDRIA